MWTYSRWAIMNTRWRRWSTLWIAPLVPLSATPWYWDSSCKWNDTIFSHDHTLTVYVSKKWNFELTRMTKALWISVVEVGSFYCIAWIYHWNRLSDFFSCWQQNPVASSNLCHWQPEHPLDGLSAKTTCIYLFVCIWRAHAFTVLGHGISSIKGSIPSCEFIVVV